MVFGGADEQPAAEAPAGWERLDLAVRRATAAVGEWRRRALDAEDEVNRLRQALEAVTQRAEAGTPAGDAVRLAAENAVLRSRSDEARRRVSSLLARLTTLETGR